ncbi:Chorion peroxidase, partial [Pseudolycoriella hygida]
LSRFLFRKDNPFGLDLAAINIHRGRDHGVRGYNDYLEATGHSRVRSFEEFGPETAAKLARVYAHPDDIDLWIGGLMERSQSNALVGPTFSDIIADQFSRFRKGDRYFFEHNPSINPGAFSEAQLQQLRQTTLSRIICDNADGYALTGVGPRAFLLPHVQGNTPVPCSDSVSIPVVDYGLWKE